jgi:hypothetical protein
LPRAAQPRATDGSGRPLTPMMLEGGKGTSNNPSEPERPRRTRDHRSSRSDGGWAGPRETTVRKS